MENSDQSQVAAAADNEPDDEPVDNESKDDEETERIQLKKWNAVALWSWDVEVDNCAICHNLVMELCELLL